MSDISAVHCSSHVITFSECAGWEEDDHSAAFSAFLKSADYSANHSYKSGSLGPDFADLAVMFKAAQKLAEHQPVDKQTARLFFEQNFIPVKLLPDHLQSGFVTGFYEPEIAASRVRTAEFSVPFYARPADLIKLDPSNRPKNLPDTLMFGRQCGETICHYFDRQAIDQGVLEGQGLELAYVADKVDAYFAHVQGAVRLNFADGSQMRLTYAAKSGHDFTGAGRVLIDKGELDPAQVTMQTIRAWLADHPARIDEILFNNRSYIFFREAAVDDPLLGPVAAAKVPLTPLRSIAVDRKYHCFGTPFFINVHDFPQNYGSYQKLMIAQDTGSAIIGPARGDLFIGSGTDAGELAGQIRHQADFIMLVPRKGEPQ